jgi:NAD(P)-dependent dehydrogenase (short-subunit alcohol dehydrogenase family)
MIEAPASRPLAIVTGGWRRVGAAIARALAADGWDLALHAHHADAFDDTLASELAAAGAAVWRVSCDLADPARAEALPAEVAQLAGRPATLLVNNASLFREDTFASLTVSALEAHMAVNFTAPLMIAKGFVGLLGELDGAIVQVLDQRVTNPVPDQISYTLSKQALHASVRTLARALAPRVRVNAVAPGPVLPTPDYADAHWQGLAGVLPLRRLPRIEDIADSVVHLARAQAITGQTLFVDGGASLEAYPRDFLYMVP